MITKKPKIAFMIIAVILAFAVVGRSSNAQGIKQELLKGIMKSVGPDATQAMMVRVISEVAKNPLLRRQILDVLGPDATKAIISSLAEHGPAAGSIPAVPAVSRGPVRGIQTQVTVETSSNPAVPMLRASRATSGGPAEATNSSSTPVKLGALAIIVNPANPVSQLTVDQLRKLASGEYTNWSQVGGPDRPVKVVTVRSGRTSVESLLNTALGPATAALAFNSFIIPAVDQNEGAIGLIPTSTLEQVDFLGKSDAVKVVGIGRDRNAVAPTSSFSVARTRLPGRATTKTLTNGKSRRQIF